MGKEALVEALWPDGGRDVGRLQYEPPRLIFRGAERRTFEGEALAGVRAEDHDLVLAGGVRFRLPGKAEGWARAILEPRGRLDKLGVKAGHHVGVINLDDPDFVEELGTRVALSQASDLDLLFYGVDSAEELARIGELVPALAPDGALWIVSLKGKAARLKDVEVMAGGRAAGLVDSKVCAFSDTRTAQRFTRRRQ